MKPKALVVLTRLAIVICIALLAPAQVSNPQIGYVTSDPTGNACPTTGIQLLLTTGALYTCQSGHYAILSGGGTIVAGTGILVSGTTVSIDSSLTATRPQVVSGTDVYLTCTSGSGTTYACAPVGNALTAYTTGQVLWWKPDVSCTAGAVTGNVSTLGAKSILRGDGSNPLASDCAAGTGKVYPIEYDGTAFRLVNNSINAGTGILITTGCPNCTISTDTSVMLTKAAYQAATPIDLVPASGSATTYTANPTPALTAYTQDQVFAFRPDVNSGAAPTLNVSTLGALPFQYDTGGGVLAAVASGALQTTRTYTIRAIGGASPTAFLVLDLPGSAALSGLTTNGVPYATSSTAITTEANTNGHVFFWSDPLQQLAIGAGSTGSTTPAFLCGYPGFNGFGGCAFNTTTLTTSTYSFLGDGVNSYFNAPSGTNFFRIANANVGNWTSSLLTSLTPFNATAYQTATNCSNAASPAVCASAAAGSVAIPTGTNPTLVVNTTAVTANSQIFLQADDSVTIASTTCNSTLATLVGGMAITARTAATSFTISFNGVVTANKLCVSYHIIN